MSESKPIRVYIAEDHAIVRKGICALLTLEIADDGAGCEPAEARRSGGLGLRGMEERVAEIGARLEIESAAGRGTQVRVVWEREAG